MFTHFVIKTQPTIEVTFALVLSKHPSPKKPVVIGKQTTVYRERNFTIDETRYGFGAMLRHEDKNERKYFTFHAIATGHD